MVIKLGWIPSDFGFKALLFARFTFGVPKLASELIQFLVPPDNTPPPRPEDVGRRHGLHRPPRAGASIRQIAENLAEA